MFSNFPTSIFIFNHHKKQILFNKNERGDIPMKGKTDKGGNKEGFNGIKSFS